MKTNPRAFTFCLDTEAGSGCLGSNPGSPASESCHLGTGVLSELSWPGDFGLLVSNVFWLRNAVILDHVSGSPAVWNCKALCQSMRPLSLPEPRGPHFKPTDSCFTVKLKKPASDFPYCYRGNRHGTEGLLQLKGLAWMMAQHHSVPLNAAQLQCYQ